MLPQGIWSGKRNVFTNTPNPVYSASHSGVARGGQGAMPNPGKQFRWWGTKDQQMAALFIESQSTVGFRMPM